MTGDKNTNDSPEDNFFKKMEEAPTLLPQRKLARSRNDILIAGVCAGIANHLKVEAANVRLVALLSLLLGGWSIIAYLLLALLIPNDTTKVETTNEEDEVLRKENFRVLISGLLMLVGFYYALEKIGFAHTGRLLIFPNTFMVPVFSLSIGIYLIIRKRIKEPVLQNDTNKTFSRSRKNRWLLGVCGGLAEYLGTDTGTLRVVFAILTLLTLGLFSAVYLIIAFKIKFENTTLNEI